jgi:predicted nucleic acid-binding protein
LPSDTIGDAARRHDPSAYAAALRHRPDAALPFDPAIAPFLPLLLDTTVYLHRSTGTLPPGIRALIASRQHMVHNCGVACAELAISIGLLDPDDPRSAATIAALRAHLDHMATDRAVAPSASAWTEAAVLAGILARTQGLAVPKRALNADQLCCQQGRRRELLLDALIFVTAVEQDMLLISANIRHMDLLLQLNPTPNVLLYRPTGRAETAAIRA